MEAHVFDTPLSEGRGRKEEDGDQELLGLVLGDQWKETAIAHLTFICEDHASCSDFNKPALCVCEKREPMMISHAQEQGGGLSEFSGNAVQQLLPYNGGEGGDGGVQLLERDAPGEEADDADEQARDQGESEGQG